MLDFQFWAQDMGTHVIIRHTFYQKVTTSPLVFHAQEVYGWKAKITTLAEELGRRLVKMDGYHTEKEISEVGTDFLQKLADSGYSHHNRKEVLKSGCTRFCRRMIEDKTGGKALYRTD